tara:strand:- start:47 stop:274 length:228 start_codon:yes stop_codon:yes gene_type:complete
MSAKIHGDKFRNILDRIRTKSSCDYYKLYEYLINNNYTPERAELKALELLQQDTVTLEKLIQNGEVQGEFIERGI